MSSTPIHFYKIFLLSSLIGLVRGQACTLKVPANPLTAEGLATPYELSGCNQLDFANQGCFVEANIFDPSTGTFQVYNPLVINVGMTPLENNNSTTSPAKPNTSRTQKKNSSPSRNVNRRAQKNNNNAGSFIKPLVPNLPAGAVVGIWFGSNAASLTLTGNTAGCVNGLGNSIFGQFAHCNGPAWFSAASAAVQSGKVKVPDLGTGSGQACPSTRDFRVVDQDQSDNVDTTYLLINKNTLAQNTPANAAANPNAEELTNGSDNALLNDFIAPALGCSVFTSPCSTCPNGTSASLATNELQAQFHPPSGGPALVPLTDDFTVVKGKYGQVSESLEKTNLYRAGVGQPQAPDEAAASGTTYCQKFAQSGIFIDQNRNLFSSKGSPAPDQATNLFTFTAMRFSTAFGPAPALGCTTIFNVANPVTLQTDSRGVVTSATIDTDVLKKILDGRIKPGGGNVNGGNRNGRNGNAGKKNAGNGKNGGGHGRGGSKHVGNSTECKKKKGGNGTKNSKGGNTEDKKKKGGNGTKSSKEGDRREVEHQAVSKCGPGHGGPGCRLERTPRKHRHRRLPPAQHSGTTS